MIDRQAVGKAGSQAAFVRALAHVALAHLSVVLGVARPLKWGRDTIRHDHKEDVAVPRVPPCQPVLDELQPFRKGSATAWPGARQHALQCINPGSVLDNDKVRPFYRL